MAGTITTTFDTPRPDYTGTITGRMKLSGGNSSGADWPDLFNKFKKVYNVLFEFTNSSSPIMIERLANTKIRSFRTSTGLIVGNPHSVFFIAKGEPVAATRERTKVEK